MDSGTQLNKRPSAGRVGLLREVLRIWAQTLGDFDPQLLTHLGPWAASFAVLHNSPAAVLAVP